MLNFQYIVAQFRIDLELQILCMHNPELMLDFYVKRRLTHDVCGSLYVTEAVLSYYECIADALVIRHAGLLRCIAAEFAIRHIDK